MTPPIDVVIHGDNWNKQDVENPCAKLPVRSQADGWRALQQIHLSLPHRQGRLRQRRRNGARELCSHYLPSGAFLDNVSAHEFFHLWNVKRIRPSTLEPVDFTREMYTRALWFAEGVTNTYASYAMFRTGIWNKQEFYQDLGSRSANWKYVPRNTGKAPKSPASTPG